jgi:hypothetical protein
LDLKPSLPVIRGKSPDKPAEPADPLAEAEAALKRLREYPKDQQAADALEKALQRLKERSKHEGEQTGNPKKS